VHRCGDETAWWQGQRIDPKPVARELWLLSHPLPNSSMLSITSSPNNKST
jgi:hypothetical protein